MWWCVPIFAASSAQCSAADSFRASFLCSFYSDLIIAEDVKYSFDVRWLNAYLKHIFLCVCEEALKYHTWKVRCCCCCCLCRIRSFSCEQSWKLCLRFSEGILYVCIDAPCVSAKGGEWVSEGEKMQSSACLSGHAIQHREKPFIQQSLPTPASKLPSNSVRAEWTRWQGSAALSPPLLYSHPEHVCFLQLPPLSHSPPKNISASSFPSVFSFLLIPFYVLPVVSFSLLRVILLHNDLLLSLLSHFLSHDALTILWSLSVHPLN